MGDTSQETKKAKGAQEPGQWPPYHHPLCRSQGSTVSKTGMGVFPAGLMSLGEELRAIVYLLYPLPLELQ
jgi:hypothetical protein